MPKVLKRAIRRPRASDNLQAKTAVSAPAESVGIDPLKPLGDLVTPPAAATALPEIEQPAGPLGPAVEEDLCPDPPFKQYNSDDLNPSQRTLHLWKFWGELPERFKSKISAYVYRIYPPLLDPPDDSKEYKYIDVVTAPFKADRDLNDRYGAGDYRVFVNVHDKKKRNLAVGMIKGNRDFKSMPPADRRITELDERGRPRWIDINDPQCKSYVEFLRTRGLMPEAWEAKREAEMEQHTDVLKSVLSMNRELIDKATSKKEDSAPLHETVGKVIAVSMEGAKAGQEILKGTIQTLQEQLSKGNNNPSNADTLKIALQIAEMISKQSDPTPYMQMITKLNETVSGLQMERLNEKIEQLRSVQQPANGATQNLSQLIEEFKRIQDLVGGGEERSPRMPGWLTAVQALADPLSRIVGNLTQAFLVSRMPQGMGGIPMPPASPPPGYAPPPSAPAPPPAIAPLAHVAPEAFAPAPAAAAPSYRDPRLYPNQEMYEQQQPAAPQQQQPQPAAGGDPHMMLLVSIAPAFLNQLRDGLGGDDLADWLVGGYGERVFADLITRAKSTGLPSHQALLMLIDSYPPLANELARENRADVERFVREFAEFDGEAYDRKRGRDAVAADVGA